MNNTKYELLSVAAIILGIVLGIFLPAGATYFAFIGKIFLALLKVLILSIIILSLFLAIARIANINSQKELGAQAIGYYLLTTTMAVTTGLVMANVFIFQSGFDTTEFQTPKPQSAPKQPADTNSQSGSPPRQSESHCLE